MKGPWQDKIHFEKELVDRDGVNDEKERRNRQKALSVDNYWRGGI